MNTAKTWVNPHILRWARERLGLTPQAVQERSQHLQRSYYTPVTAEQITQWEQGLSEPELAHLETLAEIYLCPVGWFFLDKPPEERIALNFRGLKQSPEGLSPDTLQALERFRNLAQWTADFVKRVDQTWEVRIRPAEVSPDVARAESYADAYRRRLAWTEEVQGGHVGDAKAAFNRWRRRLESLGIFCFELRLNPTEVRGASLWLEDYPFILVNRSDAEAETGRLFTLLHEFAHLISAKEAFVCDHPADGQNGNPEPFANRFAAHVLLSRRALLRRLEALGLATPRPRWSDACLDEIRRPFAVSRDVVAIRLEQMGLAPPGFYEEKRRRWQSRCAWGRGGKRTKLVEQRLEQMGSAFARLLVRASSHPAFPWTDISDVLGMKVKRVAEFLRLAEQTVGLGQVDGQ